MQDLINTCQSLSFQSRGEPADVELSVERDFPGRYGIPYAQGVVARGVESKLEQPLRGMVDELVQHLVDLNYLPAAFYDDYHQNVGDIMPPVFSKKISDAVKTYFAEDDALAEAGLSADDLDWDDFMAANDVLSIVVQRLNLLTSLDGECTIDAPIKIGEEGVFGRVLHYRLDAFGLFIKDDNIAAPVSQQTVIQTKKINLLLGRKKRWQIDFAAQELTPEDFALTGNVHVLFREFAKHHNKQLLVYKYQQPDVKPAAAYERLIVFKDKFIFGKNDKQFKRRVKRKSLDYDKVLQHIKGRGKTGTGSNIFGVRLLQLKLWMFGFYFGRIDGHYQALSHTAFLDLLEQEEKPKKHDDFMLPLDDGYWAVNLPKTAKLLAEYDKKVEDSKNQEEELIQHIPEGADEQELQAEIGNQPAEVAAFFAEAHRGKRRVYNGIKSIIASAMKGIKRIGRWIKKKAKKVAGAVISFFKSITKRIREGILIFYRALRRFTVFVLRKPVITPERLHKMPVETKFVMTRFDLDSDVTIAKSSKLEPNILQEHKRLVHNLSFGLKIFLEIAGTVISFIRNLSNPIGWIRLGVRIGKMAAELLNLRIKLPKVRLLHV